MAIHYKDVALHIDNNPHIIVKKMKRTTLNPTSVSVLDQKHGSSSSQVSCIIGESGHEISVREASTFSFE